MNGRIEKEIEAKKAMEKKTLSKITVSELIAECNVNRKTFYYHFDDIYALLKWTLEEEKENLHGIRKRSDNRGSISHLSEMSRSLSW